MTTMRMSNVTGVVADDMEPTPGCFPIPPAEFGKSLVNPDLDLRFEALAQRNRKGVGNFAIVAQEQLRGSELLTVSRKTGTFRRERAPASE